MPNIDYVIVGAGPSLTDVRNAVKGATQSVESGHDWLHPADELASLHFKSDPEVAGGTVVQVYYSADPAALGQAYARCIFEALVHDTDWDLILDSDEAAGVIASWTKSRTF